jgi:hypothetical protein
MLDMIMLALTGGQERTEAQYAELLGRAGFDLTRVIPTRSAVSVIEAVPTAWAARSESCPFAHTRSGRLPTMVVARGYVGSRIRDLRWSSVRELTDPTAPGEAWPID